MAETLPSENTPDINDIDTFFSTLTANTGPFVQKGTVPEFTITLGEDPSVQNTDPDDPSGFGNTPRAKTERLIQIIKEEATRLMCAAPSELVEMTIGKGSFHLPIYKQKNGTGGTVLFSADYTIQKHANPLHQEIHFDLPKKVDGMQLVLDDDTQPEDIKHFIGHELIHLMTRYGIHGYLQPPNEALVERQEQIYYGNKRKGITNKYEWDATTFVSTTGLCAEPNARMEYSRNANDIMRLHSFNALSTLTEQQIWEIWTLLNRKALSEDTWPGLEEVRKTMLDVVGDAAREILDQPTFQCITPGMHSFVFGTKEADVVRIQSVNVEQNPLYKNYDTGYHIGSTQYTLQDAATTMNGQPVDTKGEVIRDINICMQEDDFVEFSYDLLKNALDQNPDAKRILTGRRYGIKVQGANLQPIVLQPQDHI